jgi:hypothetical protein
MNSIPGHPQATGDHGFFIIEGKKSLDDFSLSLRDTQKLDGAQPVSIKSFRFAERCSGKL